MNAKFRAAFQIPVDHTLKETSFRSKSSSQYESWKHEEYDASGELVARYESWMKPPSGPS